MSDLILKELVVFPLFYIEEVVAGAFLGLALLGIRPGWKTILTIGFLQGLVVMVIRTSYGLLGIKLGSHIFLTLIALIIIIRHTAKVNWGIATASSLLMFISLIMGENLVLTVLIKTLKLDATEIISKSIWGHILLGYATDSLLFLLALIVGITGFSLFKPRN